MVLLSPRFAMLVSLCAAAIWMAGCASEPLDYDTALGLVKERSSDPVKLTFSASPQYSRSDPKVKRYYDQLIEGHVIMCETNGAVGLLCQPGPAGDLVSQEGSTNLAVVAGRWVPSVITRINRVGRGMVTAELRLAFEPTGLYREYQEGFESIQNSSALSTVEQKEGKSARATFSHTEDGWHLESMQ